MNTTFILVEPSVPENVGATARAIKTMGFTDLRLVNPCDYLGHKSLMLAHGSHDILTNAKVYNSLGEAIQGIDFTIATSAKDRWVKQNMINSTELLSFIENKRKIISSLAIIFGREESGLSNDDIALCDRVSAVDIPKPYPSLNLSQAVMVFAYTLSPLAAKQNLNKITSKKGIDNHGFKPLKDRVIALLNSISITEQNLVHGRVIERLSEISNEDVNLLHSIISKIEEVIDNRNC
jgi:tRNA/rRNA methyltransferase